MVYCFKNNAIFYATATSFFLLMDLGPSHQYLTKEKDRLLHPSCLPYGQVTMFSRMQIALHLIVSKFQLHLYKKNNLFHKFHFWLNASSTGFNDIAPADF